MQTLQRIATAGVDLRVRLGEVELERVPEPWLTAILTQESLGIGIFM